MAPIRVGIIGVSTHDDNGSPGAWGVKAHLRSVQGLPEYEIVAIANSTVESAKRSIAHHGLPASTKAYGNPEDIAKDPDVDLIVVSVAVGKHFYLTKPALENKKNVFVEWPLGATVAEAEELTQLAASNGVRTVVGLQARAAPLVLKVKELIASGKIGRVISTTVTGSTSVLPSDMWMKGGEYYLDMKSGANEFTVFFGHFLDTFTDVLGDFTQVQGLLKAHYTTLAVLDLSNGQVVDPAHPKTAPDHIFVHGTLAGDVVASIAFRKPKSPADGKGIHWFITGTQGEIKITTPSTSHWQIHQDETSSLQLKIGKEEYAENIGLGTSDTSPAAKVPNPGTNTARLYESFAKGDGLEATFESALKTHHLLERIAKSAGWEL